MSEVKVVYTADDFDVRAIREMQESTPWQIYADRLDSMIQAEVRRCQDPTASEPEIRRAQYTLAALRTIKGLPEQIVKEALGKAR